MLKSLIAERFSFTAFVIANVMIDVEVLVALLLGEPQLHRFLHTYAAATVVGLVAAVAAHCLFAIRFRMRAQPPDAIGRRSGVRTYPAAPGPEEEDATFIPPCTQGGLGGCFVSDPFDYRFLVHQVRWSAA